MKKQTLFNVAIYIRLSKEDGDKAESDSVVNQRKLIDDYLRGKEDFVVYDTFVDDGFSGTNFNRPAFKRMIASIEEGVVNCVIVKDLSRFGRDYIDTGKYLERYFPENDVRFISITDNIDSWKQSYDLLMPIKNIFNEQYARDISKKIHASIETKQKTGEFIGAFAAYGYKKSLTNKNKLVIDEYAAGVVRKIFSLYVAGCGKVRIAALLNEEGIVCPSVYKRLNGANYQNSNRLDSTSYWTYSTVNRILQNELYIGNMVQGRKTQQMRGHQRLRDKEDWIVVKGTHEAIIDMKTWEKTQSLLSRRTRKLDMTTNMSIYAGFLKCGDCGRSMVKHIDGVKHGNGTIHYYCGTYVRTGRKFCTPHPMLKTTLDKIILDDIKVIIRSITDLRELVNKNKEISASIEQNVKDGVQQIEVELQRIQKLKKSVYEDYKDGLISKDEYITYRQDYINKEELLKKQLCAFEERTQSDTNTDVFENPWVKRLLELQDIEALDRDIIVELIHDITVYSDNRIKVTYNFSDELQPLFATTIEIQN